MTQRARVTRDRRIPPILTNNFLRYWFSPPGRLVRKYVSAGTRVADLGCGAGFHTIVLARAVGDGGRVHAVDFDGKAIGRLQRRARRHGFDRVIAAHTASAAEIDFIPDASVHFVLAEGLLCCMTDHAGAVRQIRRILHPAGRAYLSVVKLARPDDPRGVSGAEWERLLSAFSPLDRGEGLMSRWALVGPSGAELPGSLRASAQSSGPHLPCC